MKFHYDVNGAEPILRDVRIYAAAAMRAGQAVCSGAVGTPENCGCAIVADPVKVQNIMGVLNEDVTAANALGVVATGVDKYAKIIINPGAVYLAEYSQLAADDTVTSTTTAKTLTGTMVTDHERGWAYVTNVGSTAGGYGNLFQAGAATSTTALVAATSYDDDMIATNSSDTFIVMPAPYSADVAGYGIDLCPDGDGYESINISGYAGTGAGAVMVLDNYIASKTRPLEPLVCAKHSGYNYSSEAPKFYADIFFPEHLLYGGNVNTRPIT